MRHITPHYEEIFSFFTPDEFRQANDRLIVEQQGRQKHVEISSFDREILARVQARRGLHGAEVLHPSQMYQLFDNFWLQRTPVTLVEAFSLFAPIPAGEPTGIRAHLPERYVAAKFYGNSALPPTPENREFVTSYLTDLAQQIDVVLLNTAQRFDDHSDFPPSLRGRLHTIDHLMAPETNLAVQTEVIRNAQAFVGTYGGFSYLAPLCGVNTLAFYSHAGGFRFDHLEVAKRVFSALKCGTFTEVDLRAAEGLRLGFGECGPRLARSNDNGARNLDEPGRRRGDPRFAVRRAMRAHAGSSTAGAGPESDAEADPQRVACGPAHAEAGRNRVVNAYKALVRLVRRPVRAASRRESHPGRWGFYRTSGTSSARSRPLSRATACSSPDRGSEWLQTLYCAVPPLAEDGLSRRSPRVAPCAAASTAGTGVAGRYVEMWRTWSRPSSRGATPPAA